MPATFKWPKPLEAFFIFMTLCLLIAPELVMKITVFDSMAVLQLILMLLFAAGLVLPLWSFYRTFLKAPLRARRIARIRHDRMLREIIEERKIQERLPDGASQD
jgi:hypothetical protein